jgi:hypothetical protein
MPNLYFCQPNSHSQGVLRAVMSWEECRRVLNLKLAVYVGERFPSLSNGSAGAKSFAVLGVLQGEADGGRRAGYYRLDVDLAEINEALRALEKQPSVT